MADQAEAQRARASGLQALRTIIDGGREGPAISKVLNFRMESAEEGEVTFVGTPLPDFANPAGTVHGGWYGTVLDSCMTCAVLSRLPAGRGCTTLEFKVNILRPIPYGTEVRATGRTQHVGRRTGVAVGELVGVADGRLYATGSTTCAVLELSPDEMF
ncbi:PaaI family thioesterase [Oceanicola sp. S124]|uniref:PaaI family thioesterase n=1 Tax=Oceanicola sp. S124 TaxID=1042378 RepID=UPI000255A44E|nr:PaaI family thioesterase [Oceanicola sp. S124]